MKCDESAVSPVVGVMLMLVVTIIIAAVVSGFAGGLASDEARGRQATLSCKPVLEGIEDTDQADWASTYPENWTADNGLIFEHKGGDGFALSDIAVQLQTQDVMTTITATDVLPAARCTSDEVTAYFMEIGDTDGYILPGDKFVLYADNCRIDDVPAYGFENAHQLSWQPEGSVSGFGIYTNTECEYKIIDKKSNTVIQQGSFVFH